jgi:hypothetical protein
MPTKRTEMAGGELASAKMRTAVVWWIASAMISSTAIVATYSSENRSSDSDGSALASL